MLRLQTATGMSYGRSRARRLLTLRVSKLLSTNRSMSCLARTLPKDPTPLRIKGLFDDGACVVDRLLTDIKEEHKWHVTCTSQQITSLEESEMFTCRAIRADVTSLQTETGNALTLLRTLLRTETKDALTLLQTETREALSLTFNSISGLTASALKLDQDVTGLLESSARATQDILELRQKLTGGGSLSDLAALARQSEQAVIGLLETSAKNAQAILELRQELAGCVALKNTVDDIKTRQLTKIRENISQVKTGLADITTQYANLDSKYSDPSTLSILGWMTSFARTYHPQRLHRTTPRHPRWAMQLLPHRPRRLWAPRCLRRLM